MTKVNKNEVFSTICRTEEKYIIDEYNDHWYKIEYQPDMFGWIYGGYYKTEADNLSANSYYEIMVNQLWWELYTDTVKETNGSECFEKVLARKSLFNRIEYMGRNDDGPPSMT